MRRRVALLGWVAGLMGCGAGPAPSPRDGPEAPVDPGELEQGHPGIQIGQSGTELCVESAAAPVEDPAAPSPGLGYAAADWLAQLPEDLEGALELADGATADLGGVPLSIGIDGVGAPARSVCDADYVVEATVRFVAGDLLDETLSAVLVSSGVDRTRWRVAVRAEAVVGGIEPPDLGALDVRALELAVTGSLQGRAAEGDIVWLAWTVDDGWMVPVAGWSAAPTP
jgi:hypothetical protein